MVKILNNRPNVVRQNTLRLRSRIPRVNLGDLLSVQKGLSLVETLVATAILAVAVVMLASAFSTGTISMRKADTRATAANLARSQLEFTKSLQYLPSPASYATISTLPQGYSVSSEATAVSGRDSNTQKVLVTIYLDGDPILTMEDFKLK